MKEKLVPLIGIVIAVLFIVNIVIVLFFYKDYSNNITTINQQNGLTRVRLETVERDMAASREALDTKIKGYDQTMATMDGRVGTAETNMNDLLSKVQGIKTSFDEWSGKYASTMTQIAELKDKTDALTANVEEIKKYTTGNVNLGKIAVQSAPEAKPEEGAQKTDAAATPPAEEKKAE